MTDTAGPDGDLYSNNHRKPGGVRSKSGECFRSLYRRPTNADHYGRGFSRKSSPQRRGNLCARRHCRSRNVRFGSKQIVTPPNRDVGCVPKACIGANSIPGDQSNTPFCDGHHIRTGQARLISKSTKGKFYLRYIGGIAPDGDRNDLPWCLAFQLLKTAPFRFKRLP